MSLFNVFIERARSPAPAAAAQLAKAIGARYGIAAEEVERRLAIGRFRVKGNVDRATADSFAADLERLGAVVRISPIEDEAPVAKPVVAPPVSLQQARVAPPTPVAAPAKPVAPANPVAPVAAPAKPVAAPVAPVAPVAAPAKPVAAEAPVAAPAKPVAASPSKYSSGLAAAAAHDLEEPGLGALSGNFPLTLSTLDGADDDSVSSGSRAAVALPASFGPPAPATGSGPPVGDGDGDVDVAMDDDSDDGLGLMEAGQLPASFGPAAGVTALGGAAPAPSRAAAPNHSGPADLFAPPDAHEEMQLALDVEKPARNRASTAPPPAQMAARMSSPSPSSPPEPGPRASPPARIRGEASWKTHGRDERVRFVAGVVLAAAFGFIPAAVVGSVRERSAFAELDGALREREAQVLTRADWDALDRVRASFLERKQAERHSIGFTSLLIWAAASGALAYVWFRVIDWDRVFGSPPAGD